MKILRSAPKSVLALTISPLLFMMPSISQAGLAAEPMSAFGTPSVSAANFASGTSLNGLAANGLSFSDTAGGFTVSNGPGTTNVFSNPTQFVSNSTPSVITVNFATLETMFGFGFAAFENGSFNNIFTVSLFNSGDSLGSLSYGGNSDPNFTGGYVGILSTAAFNSATITFNAPIAQAFAIDNFNVTAANAAVPEPATIALLASGLIGLTGLRKKSR